MQSDLKIPIDELLLQGLGGVSSMKGLHFIFLEFQLLGINSSIFLKMQHFNLQRLQTKLINQWLIDILLPKNNPYECGLFPHSFSFWGSTLFNDEHNTLFIVYNFQKISKWYFSQGEISNFMALEQAEYGINVIFGFSDHRNTLLI